MDCLRIAIIVQINAIRPFDVDVMLEVKEKEAAAITALRIAGRDKRLLT
jgi:hypothetical protein